MTDKRADGRYLLIIGAAILALLSSALWLTMDWSMADFKALYYAARCVDQHLDPYDASNVIPLVRKDGVDRADRPTIVATMDTHNPYPPTQFAVTAPLGLLKLRSAGLVWGLLSLASLVLGALAVWRAGAGYSPIVSGMLIGFMLANSETLIALGNAAAIATGLCVAAAWCLLYERHASLGVIALAVTLILKPQDSGLVWLFLIMAGGAYRKRALQALVVTVALSAPAVLWVNTLAPHWPGELIAIIAEYNKQGGINDPGPTSPMWPSAMVNLQTVVSLVDNSPNHYNAITSLVCALLLIPLAIATLRSKVTASDAWTGLAAISAITMLAGYHRRGDTKLLLICVPACVLLFSQRDLRGRLALCVTAGAIFLTGDNTWVVSFEVLRHLQLHHKQLADSLQAPLQVLPAPLSMLAVAAFYVWVYIDRLSGPGRREDAVA